MERYDLIFTLKKREYYLTITNLTWIITALKPLINFL